MTPSEFVDFFSSLEAELKSASSNPAAISETLVCTYMLCKMKKSAQEGIMNSFQDLSQNIGRVLAGQTNNINNTTAELLAVVLKRLDEVENKIQSIQS